MAVQPGIQYKAPESIKAWAVRQKVPPRRPSLVYTASISAKSKTGADSLSYGIPYIAQCMAEIGGIG
jgi:hypothetical protein